MSPVGIKTRYSILQLLYQLCCEQSLHQGTSVSKIDSQFLCNAVHSTNWSPTGEKCEMFTID